MHILLLFRDYTRPELPSGDSEAGATGATGLPDITAALAGTCCTLSSFVLVEYLFEYYQYSAYTVLVNLMLFVGELE